MGIGAELSVGVADGVGALVGVGDGVSGLGEGVGVGVRVGDDGGVCVTRLVASIVFKINVAICSRVTGCEGP